MLYNKYYYPAPGSTESLFTGFYTYDCWRNLTTDPDNIVINVSGIMTYPHVKIRAYNLASDRVLEFFPNTLLMPGPLVGTGDNNHGKTNYFFCMMDLFDNLGAVTYVENRDGGRINIGEFIGINKITLIETDTVGYLASQEQAILYSGSWFIENAQNPSAKFMQFGDFETNSNQVVTGIHRQEQVYSTL